MPLSEGQPLEHLSHLVLWHNLFIILIILSYIFTMYSIIHNSILLYRITYLFGIKGHGNSITKCSKKLKDSFSYPFT